MATLTRLFSAIAFPLVMGAAVAGAIASMNRGVEPSLSIAGPILGSFLFVVAFERIFPYHESWNRNRGDMSVDAGFAVTDFLVERTIQLALAPVVAAGGVWLSVRIGIPLWPSGWPLLTQLVLALVFAEFFKYWGHRWMHEWDWLWRLHAVHHSVPRLYWLNASRFHPVDIGIDTGLGVLSLVLVGCGKEVLALFILVTAVHGVFQHCNLRLRLGPLNWFFSMAELHRWHHSRTVEEANNNYGNNVIVWDIVFGTRYLPVDREPPEDTGLHMLASFPTTFLGQMAVPVRWRQIKAESAQRARAIGAAAVAASAVEQG
jgi:sterol desaturase/sphingolipid hydroxylase (fatty acid hydroxylase superfamily)